MMTEEIKKEVPIAFAQLEQAKSAFDKIAELIAEHKAFGLEQLEKLELPDPWEGLSKESIINLYKSNFIAFEAGYQQLKAAHSNLADFRWSPSIEDYSDLDLEEEKS